MKRFNISAKSLLATTLLSCSLFSFANTAEIDQKLLEQAKQGDGLAQGKVAYQYCDIGDYEESLVWLEKYANNTSLSQEKREFAQHTIADAYAKGTCDITNKQQQFTPDYYKALEWYQHLAFTQKPETPLLYSAKFQIAEIYNFRKDGIAQDGEKAKRYYTEIANISDNTLNSFSKRGVAALKETRGRARYRLAQMYYFGDFARQDDQLAYQWANKALADNSEQGGIMVAVMQYRGKGTTQNKVKAIDLMGKICDIRANQKACDWYKDMKADKPLREGSL
ncbi:hypothetical protein A1D22_01320 [Pasteurellaceae bacterium LFhippo2]|nr:hypothetical protein [Pasteurellaceae bacterium LFhippo2]